MRKKKTTELEVDFIGGEGPLTPEDAMLVSEYIKAQKLKREKALARKKKKPVTGEKKRVA